MTLIEAIKTDRPLTRKNKVWSYTPTSIYYVGMPSRYTILPGTFIDPEYFLQTIRLEAADILADDWIIQGDFTQYDYETVE